MLIYNIIICLQPLYHPWLSTVQSAFTATSLLVMSFSSLPSHSYFSSRISAQPTLAFLISTMEHKKSTTKGMQKHQMVQLISTVLHMLMRLVEQHIVKLYKFGIPTVGPQTTGLAGTLGYLAPEYIMTGRASKESDVFSFGIVALEIACGRRPLCMKDSDVGLLEWVWDHYGKGTLLSAADKRLDVKLDAKKIQCLMTVGLWCAHPDWNLRPDIRQAIQALHFETVLPTLPSKMPVLMYHESSASAISREPSLSYESIAVGR